MVHTTKQRHTLLIIPRVTGHPCVPACLQFIEFAARNGDEEVREVIADCLITLATSADMSRYRSLIGPTSQRLLRRAGRRRI